MLKKKLLNERMTIPMESELKKELAELRRQHGVDILEWIRRMIRRELPGLKNRVA